MRSHSAGGVDGVGYRAQGKYNNRLGLSAVAILAALLLTGLYLFVLPYVNKWRG